MLYREKETEGSGRTMKAIVVEGLTKTFRTKRKAEGLAAAVRGLFRPDVVDRTAVAPISFA